MTRIVFRLGSVIPTYEFLEVGEPVFDSDKFRLGIGLGNDVPLWYPRIDVDNQDQINIGNSLHRSEVGGKLARFGFNAPDQWVLTTKSGTRVVIGDTNTVFYNSVQMTAGGSLSGDWNTSGGRFTDINIRRIIVNSDTDRVSIVNGDTGKEIGHMDARGLSSVAQREMMLVLGAMAESQAAQNRAIYSSGLVSARSYTFSHPFNRRGKKHLGGDSVLNMHSHPEFRGLGGIGELALMVNGHFLQTRHVDYKTMRPLKTLVFGQRGMNTGVPVPSAVTSLPTGYSGINLIGNLAGTQVDWMRNVYTNSKQYCVYELVYLEMWLQKFDMNYLEIATSSRQANETRVFKDILEKMSYYARSGLKIPIENIGLPNGVVATFDAEGHPVLAYVNWRVGSIPVATMYDREVDLTMDGITYHLKSLPYIPEKSAAGVIDGTNRFRLRRNLQARYMRERRSDDPIYDDAVTTAFNSDANKASWAAIQNSNGAIFDVEGLAELCRQVPGFNGIGDYSAQIFKDPTGQQTLVSGTKQDVYFSPYDEKGFFYYDSLYKTAVNDAMGYSRSTRGFNDPNLFTAKTNFKEVVGGWSFMVPLELVLRTPRENWNPFAVVKRDAPTGDGSSSKPYNGWNDNGQFFTIPYDAMNSVVDYSNSIRATDGDTRGTAYMVTGAGTKMMVGNGLRTFDITGERRRFPIIPESLRTDQNGVEIEFLKEVMKGLLRKAAAGTLTGSEIDDAF